MVWTDEMRAKAAATRAAKKAGRDGENATNGNGHHPTPNGVSPEIHASHASGCSIPVSEDGFDWEDAPISQAINKAADMRRELDRAQAIILRRQNPPRKMWTCWTQLMKGNLEIPKKVLQECLRRGEDGKWKFRDDGRFTVVNGVRTLDPAFCCNYLCFAIYQKYRVTPPTREAQRQA